MSKRVSNRALRAGASALQKIVDAACSLTCEELQLAKASGLSLPQMLADILEAREYLLMTADKRNLQKRQSKAGIKARNRQLKMWEGALDEKAEV